MGTARNDGRRDAKTDAVKTIGRAHEGWRVGWNWDRDDDHSDTRTTCVYFDPS